MQDYLCEKFIPVKNVFSSWIKCSIYLNYTKRIMYWVINNFDGEQICLFKIAM